MDQCGAMNRWWVALALLFQSCGTHGAPVYAHPQDLFTCGKHMGVSPVSIRLLSEDTLPNGLYAERYDLTGDGQIDVVTLSSIKTTKIYPSEDRIEIIHSEHPVFYMVDRDADGEPDMVYIDTGVGGKCEQIVLYHDLTRPQTPNDEETKSGKLF